MIKLKDITEDNFYQVIQLTLPAAQAKFVAPNVQSLAECYLYRADNDVFPYAIYKDKTVVGFVLLYSDETDQSMTIWRIMIGEPYQGKGYGFEAMTIVEQMVSEQQQFTHLYTTYSPHNLIAKKLYDRLAFKEFRMNEHGEVVVRKELL